MKTEKQTNASFQAKDTIGDSVLARTNAADPSVAEPSVDDPSVAQALTGLSPTLPKKRIHLICQAKGGVGKSFFTYLIYHKYQADESVAYLDLDNTNQTTLSRLKDKARSFNVLDTKKKINREAFLTLIENISLSQTKNTFWVDMGATESIEFVHMLTHSYPPALLKEEFDPLGIELSFTVILSGGDVHMACIRFLHQLDSVVNGVFPITCQVNRGRFNLELDADYLTEIEGFASDRIRVCHFGSTDHEQSDAQLIELIKNGALIDPARLSLPTRIKYRRLISEIE